MGAWGGAIASFFTVVALILKAWEASKPKWEEKNREKEIQQGRQAIAAAGDAAVSARIDSVLSQAPGDSQGLGSDEDTTRRLAKITRGGGLADR